MSFLLACALTLCGCGGATGAAGAGQTSVKLATEPPPLPDEPLLLVPPGPRLLARADVAQLRGSAYFELGKRFLRQAACVDPASAPWLLERTDKLVVAGFGEEGALPELVAVAFGRYDAADAQQAASQWFATRKLPLPAVRTQGRVAAWSGPEQSVARIGDKLLVAGPSARVEAVLAVSEGKQPNALAAVAVIPELDARSWLETHSVAVIAQLDPRTAKRFGASLDELGAGEIRQGLDHGAAALALVLTRDAHAELQALYANPQQAEAAAARIRDMLGQASFVLRLMGLPAALTQMDVRSHGSVLSLALSLSESEAQDLEERFAPMLESSLPACAGRAALERTLAQGNRERARASGP